MLFKELTRYEEASEAFRTLTEKYPDSRMYEPAKYQWALCAKAASLKPDYDQELTKEARKNFKELADKRSETVVGMDVRKELSMLDEKDAKKAYDVAAFYDKQNNLKAAKIYYKVVVAKYPSTPFGERAKARVKALEEAGQ
jgi:outer membrane protein assembly factor BamD (BamD/ComL family)